MKINVQEYLESAVEYENLHFSNSDISRIMAYAGLVGLMVSMWEMGKTAEQAQIWIDEFAKEKKQQTLEKRLGL